jgi:hypothetical protein
LDERTAGDLFGRDHTVRRERIHGIKPRFGGVGSAWRKRRDRRTTSPRR